MKWMIQRKIWLLLGFVLFLGLLTGAYFRVAEKNEGSGPVEVVLSRRKMTPTASFWCRRVRPS